MNKNYFFIILLVLSVTLVGCNSNKVIINDASQSKYYSIALTQNFNESMCSSTGYGSSGNSSNWGIRIIIKDNDTNNILNGSATYISDLGGGSISIDPSYTCEENALENPQTISVYSQGYSPLVFIMIPSRNTLMTVEVLLLKSCSGAPSCFDNFEIQNSQLKIDNRTYYDGLLKDYNNTFYDYLDNNFGINRTDYVLQCMECNLGRGGYVKAKGTYKNGTDLELYYHWGWCSSGGSDCGYSKCISTNSEDIINAEKTDYCDKLIWNGRNDNSTCLDEEFNNDTIIRNDCLHGKFENINSGKQTFALSQTSNRCSSIVSNANYDCIGS